MDLFLHLVLTGMNSREETDRTINLSKSNRNLNGVWFDSDFEVTSYISKNLL